MTTLRARAAGLDWLVIAAAAVLSGLGVVLVASASPAGGYAEAKRQFLSLLVAVLVAALVARVEPRALRAWAPALYLAGMAGMLLAFTPLGVSIAGARAWVKLPLGFTVQPSEFGKLALIVAVAATLDVGSRVAAPPTRAVLRALGLAAVPLGIMLAGNDTGSAMITAGTVAVMLVAAQVSWRWLAGLAAAGAAVAVLAVTTGVLADYQMRRLATFLHPDADPYGAGLNTIQARIAIGSGGWFGRGLFAGPQTQGGFVPVNDSDFVFTVAAEELGLLGAGLLLAVIGVLLWRGVRIAGAAPDRFGLLVATGVVGWFALQSFENIGMNLGLMPVTGVTLPFVSYGGSSLIAAWCAVGLLQLVHLRGRRA